MVTDANLLTSIRNFKRNDEVGEEVVELLEKTLLNTFKKGRVKMFKEAHFIVIELIFRVCVVTDANLLNSMSRCDNVCQCVW